MRSCGRLRSIVQVAVACALALSAVKPVHADSSDTNSGSVAGELLESCGVSAGDKAFGIQVVTDISCSADGLGCYNDHCRYCKVVDTLKSAHLENCETLGASFPSMAPLTVSTGSCSVSSGDAAVGVGGMTDPTCLYGGIGCFKDHCRFCQTELTPQSSQFVLCSWGASSTGSSGSTDPDAGDAGFVPTRILNGADKPVASLMSADSSSFAENEEALEAGVTSVCTTSVSDGDAAVGINIITDTTCANGGLGCMDSVCRMCQAKSTPQSAHLQKCSDFVSTACSQVASEGDAAVGIQIGTDTTCAQGGLGCIDDVCRFCRMTTTVQSSAFVDCASMGGSASATKAPTLAPTTATPVTIAPVVSSTPVPTMAKQTCSQTVSDGDAAVGIKIVTDSSCTSGGLGCIDQVCRFCRVLTTVQSAPFVDCATIEDLTTTPARTAAAPTATPAPSTAAPTTPPAAASTTTPAPSTAAPTTTPAPSTAAPTITPAPTTAAPTSAPTTATSAPSAVCSLTAAVGDNAVGIDIVPDASCAAGGLGCIDTVCRFCRTLTTTQSASYTDCATITGSGTPAPTVATPAPTAAPTPTSTGSADSPSIVFECSRTVSSGDKGIGLDIVSDIRCSDGGAGCLDGVCRFCKRFDTSQSQSYINCSSIPSADIGLDIAFVPIRLVSDSDEPTRMLVSESSTDSSNTTDASTNTNITINAETSNSIDGSSESFEATATSICTRTVSDGDAAVGINVITDVSCVNGGLGCMDSVCRLCKTKSTDQSAHLGSCSDYVSTTATSTMPAPTSAPVSTTSTYSIPLNCYQTVSNGDKSLGLDIVTDIRCGDGGVGCVDGICRFCKRFDTTQSQSYMSCSDIPSSDNGGDITFKTIAAIDMQESTSSTDTIVATHETAALTTESADEACEDVPLADGQAAGGIGVVLDTVNCPLGLASGCIGDAGCRFCMRFPTNISEYLDYCAVVNSTSVAYALSGTAPSVQDGSSTVVSVEPGDNEEQISDASASQKVRRGPAPLLLSAGAVACVAVIAVVGLAAFGIKRTIGGLAAQPTERKKVIPDDENRPSVLISSTVGEPGVICDA
jgi:hypothetical protein